MPDVMGGNDTSLPANGSICLPCPVNTYQPRTGQTLCNLCPAGYSTQDAGNAACDPCTPGYYSPVAGGYHWEGQAQAKGRRARAKSTCRKREKDAWEQLGSRPSCSG